MKFIKLIWIWKYWFIW